MKEEKVCIKNEESEIVSPLFNTFGDLAKWAAENWKLVDEFDDTFYVAFGTLDKWNYFDTEDYSELWTLKNAAKELVGDVKPDKHFDIVANNNGGDKTVKTMTTAKKYIQKFCEEFGGCTLFVIVGGEITKTETFKRKIY